jgi:hypothetical protein
MFEMQDKQILMVGRGRRGGLARGRFTPCAPDGSLLEAMTEAAKCWILGGAVLLSPACSSYNQFRNEQNCGEEFYRPAKSTGRGATNGNPNINDINNDNLMRKADRQRNHKFVPRFCEGKPRSKNNATQTSMKGRDQRQEYE